LYLRVSDNGNTQNYRVSGLYLSSGFPNTSDSVVVKALCYKPERRVFDTRRCFFFNLPNRSGHTRPWGLLGL
jgi:hypothetical protein